MEENKKRVCPKCGSEHIVWHGYAITVKRGRRRRLKCQDGGHTFYEDSQEEVK